MPSLPFNTSMRDLYQCSPTVAPKAIRGSRRANESVRAIRIPQTKDLLELIAVKLKNESLGRCFDVAPGEALVERLPAVPRLGCPAKPKMLANKHNYYFKRGLKCRNLLLCVCTFPAEKWRRNCSQKDNLMRAINLTPTAIVTADESTGVISAAKLMREQGVGDIVITRGSERDSRPVGVLTDRDIVVHAIACDLDLNAITAGDLGLRKLTTVSPDADLTEITAEMKRHGVRRVLIANGSEILGLVSIDDVIAAVAELLNNLTAMLNCQVRYEKEHIVPTELRESAA